MKNFNAFINDSFVSLSDATIGVKDLAIQRGYGIFDYFKTVDGKPIFLQDHLDRFYKSAEYLRLPVTYDGEEFGSILEELMTLNQLENSGIKIVLTGGYSEDGYSISKPNLIIIQEPLVITPIPFIRLVSYNHQRQLPLVKSIDYLMPVWLAPYIRENNADDVLYEKDGMISECPRANFFIVNDENEICTPASNVLNGITRKKLLSLQSHGYRIREQDISLEDVYRAREAFITSTTKLIVPVTVLNGRKIGTGTPGPTSKELFNQLMAMMQQS